MTTWRHLKAEHQALVSQTIKHLAGGAGIRFAERGSHTLKGVPGSWQLFAVAE